MLVAEEELHGAQVTGPAINLSGFVPRIECVP